MTNRTPRCPISGVEVSLCECLEHKPQKRKRYPNGKLKEPSGRVAEPALICSSKAHHARHATARRREILGRQPRTLCDDCYERLLLERADRDARPVAVPGGRSRPAERGAA